LSNSRNQHSVEGKETRTSSLLKSKLGYIHEEQASFYGLQEEKNTSLHWWIHQSLRTCIETVGVGWQCGSWVSCKTDFAIVTTP